MIALGLLMIALSLGAVAFILDEILDPTKF